MNSLDYYQHNIAPRGSDLYYATRKMANTPHQQLLALFSFVKEITDVIDECSDQGVSRIKLQWWLEQIEKMYAGKAGHPVAIGFGKVCNAINIPEELIQALVHGQFYLLENPRCDSIDAQITMCQKTNGVVSDLQSRVLGFKNENTIDFAKSMGVFHGLLDVIISLRTHLLKDRVYLAPEDLKAHDLSVETLWGLSHFPALQQVLLQTADRAREYYQQAVRVLPECDIKLQRPACLRAKLKLKLLDEVEKDGFRILSHRVELTPLQKLFCTL